MVANRATWGVKELDTGLIVARGSVPTADEAIREAAHYAIQYGQDGPVCYWVKQDGKILVQGSLNGVTIVATPDDAN